MFKLGEYRESDAKAIAGHLKNAGVKVELRPSIDASIESDDVLQGKFSELKVDIKDKNLIGKYERYLDALKVTLHENPDFHDFSERYLHKLFSTIEEKRKIIQEMLADSRSGSEKDDSKGENQRQGSTDERTDELPNHIVASEGRADTSIDESLGGEGSDNDGSDDTESVDNASGNNLPQELIEALADFAGIMREDSEAEAFASSVINLNNIEDGIEVGGLLDDPIVAVPIDRDDYEGDPKLKRILSVYLRKNYDLYVDEFTLLYMEKPDKEFIEVYTDENIKIGSMRLLLDDLIENHPSEKMDFQDFEDECVSHIDSEKRVLKIFGYSAASEIAKTLEKNGMIKIKGDVIRWRK